MKTDQQYNKFILVVNIFHLYFFFFCIYMFMNLYLNQL